MMRRRRTLVFSTGLLLLTLMAGCSTPTAPTTTTLPPPSPALFTLSGVVYEHTPAGVRPLAGVPLDVSPLGRGRPKPVTTDAEGRYQVSNLPAGALTVNADSLDHFLQPCRTAITLAGDSALDVHLVPVSAMKAAGIPPTFPVLQPTLSGRVFERTPEGVRAVLEAHLILDFSGGDGWDPGAQSISDSSGQYVFCNITAGAELGLAIWAAKEGYRDAFFLIGRPGNSTTYDVELVRK